MREVRRDGTESSAALPQGTPLFADTAMAEALFGVGRQTLFKLKNEHADFPAGQMVGARGKILYDVPRCYVWLARYLGTDAK